MLIQGVWSLILCILYVTSLLALPNGRVATWIHSGFCKGRQGLTALPWDCTGYLNCSADYSHWTNCEPGCKFDAVAKKCLNSSTTCDNPEYVAAKYCPLYSFLKFAHWKTCAQYFDCSRTNALFEYRLKIFEEECLWSEIFDPVKLECSRPQSQDPKLCTKMPRREDYFREWGPYISNDCVGLSDGPHPDPLQTFLPDYIVCTEGKVTGRPRCDMLKNEIFHPVQKTCVQYSENIIEEYCEKNPGETFADPHLCSMYFNCTVKNHNTVLDSYKTECPYMYLYDLRSKSCKRYNETTCGYRLEPKAPCDYRMDCPADGDCASCDATCIGLPDGDNPYRKYPNTRFHLTCEGERTLSIKECTPPEIFLPGKKMCGMEGDDDDGTTTSAATTNIHTTTTDKTTTATTPEDTTTTSTVTETTATETTASTTTADTTSRTTDSTTTVEPDTSNRMYCNTCGSQLDGFKDDVELLLNETERVSEKVNEPLPGPFQCTTPPAEDNCVLKTSYSSFAKTAEYECDEDFTMCGGHTHSACTTQNQWTDTGGYCVQNTWTKFNDTDRITLTYNCPVDELVLTIRGRYIGDMFVFTLVNTDNVSDIDMFQYTNPEGNMIAFGDPGAMKAQLRQLYLANEHEWTLRLDKDNSYVSLDGKHLGQSTHNIDLQLNMTLTIIGGFKPVRVTFQNGPPTMVRHTDDLSINLAYVRPVQTSSSHKSSSPYGLTDGQNLVQWESHSCWASTVADVNPSITIDLGQDFYISKLVLTTADCTIETCGILHDIEIIVWRYRDNAAPEELLCAKHEGILPKSHVQKIPCKKDINGRFVIINRTVRLNEQDKMAVCEVEVYGGHVIPGDWSPHDCPNPPLIPNAEVQLDYTPTEAFAMYTCDKTHDTCYDNNILHCDGPRGWNAVPHYCIQTFFEATLYQGVSSFAACPFTLGNGIELWLTPKGTDMSLTLYDAVALKSVLGMNIKLHSDGGVVQFSNTMTIPTSMFVKNKEAHVVISSLTDHVLIEVDDTPFYEFPLDSDTALTINMVKIGTDLYVRKARSYRNMPKVTRAEVMENGRPKNLAFQETSTSSSNYRTLPDIAFDNDLGSNYEEGGCWHSAIDDENPWIQVDLGKQYYIKNVDISLKNDCPGCGSINIAKGRPAFGSEGVDSKSSPDNLVDGLPKPDYDEGSCFASAGADAWWMVDLGGSFPIKELSLLGQAGELDKFSDLQVHIFDENPEKVDTAVPTLCKKHSGQLDGEQKIVCDSVVQGQFVKITKLDGADPYMAMCEVEVYARLDDRLHDFEIKVFQGKPSLHEVSKVCHKFTGEFTAVQGTVVCEEGTFGRYIRLEGTRLDGVDDLMTICEMAVYGVKLVKRVWSPYDCPNPPLMPNAEVVVSQCIKQATAKYKCKDGYSHMCGSDVIHCQGVVGWIGVPSDCKRTTFSSKKDIGLSSVSLPCNLRLGQAIEIAYTPTTERSTLQLKDQSLGDSILDITIFVTQSSLRIISDRGLRVTADADIKLNKEFSMTFTFLSRTVDIAMDGVYLTHIDTNGLVDTVTATNPRLRSVRVIPASETVTEDRSYHPHITNEGLTATASSTDASGGEPRRVIDGDRRRDSTLGSCWTSAVGDLTPYLHIDLDHYFYIESVVIITKSDCTGDCAERTHDILITVYYEVPGTTTEIPQMCFYRQGAIPPDTKEVIVCRTAVRGRYVRLEGLNRRDVNDQLTFCEVTVYGGEVIRKPSAIITKAPVTAKTVGYRCKTNTECDFPHGVCEDGGCACDVKNGYNYDSVNDKCQIGSF